MEQQNPSEKTKEIASIADYLKNREEEILREWKNQIVEGSDPNSEQTETLASLSLTKFFNSFPEILRNIGEILLERDSDLEKLSRKHGNERWEYGFDLRLVTEEWGRLHLILMKHLNAAKTDLAIESEMMQEMQRRLAEFIHTAIKNSVDEYYKLQELRAQTKLRDMQNIINKSKDISTKRGMSLQQVSHDVGGSMVALKLNLKFLEKAVENVEAKKILDHVSVSTKNLSQLLDNLLDLFRLEAGREGVEIKTFDASELLKNLGANIHSLAAAQHLELKVKGPEYLEVEGDPVKVKRIAQNLLLNSLKYTKSGHIELNWKVQDENHWIIDISDTGPGLDATTAALFTNIYDGNKINPSTDSSERDEDYGPEEVEMHSEGIGLLIVRQLCQMLNAVANVTAKPNEGTHFEIALPLKY